MRFVKACLFGLLGSFLLAAPPTADAVPDPFLADLVTITRSMYSVGRKTQHDVLRV